MASVATAAYPMSAQMYATSGRTGYEQYPQTSQSTPNATTYSYSARTQVFIFNSNDLNFLFENLLFSRQHLPLGSPLMRDNTKRLLKALPIHTLVVRVIPILIVLLSLIMPQVMSCLSFKSKCH